MKYLFLFNGRAEGQMAEPGSAAWMETLRAYQAADAAMVEAGVMIDCAPLQPPEAATTVRIRNGETLLTDGPAAEIKEQLGGYALVDCADLDEALEWAATIPAAVHGSVEVRPILEVPS
ncbi:MAG TPA: YciI family protein [Acidimicrobiales bacterium]|nr:YciI family protein [Acidimicrobiales bacterium]